MGAWVHGSAACAGQRQAAKRLADGFWRGGGGGDVDQGGGSEGGGGGVGSGNERRGGRAELGDGLRDEWREKACAEAPHVGRPTSSAAERERVQCGGGRRWAVRRAIMFWAAGLKLFWKGGKVRCSFCTESWPRYLMKASTTANRHHHPVRGSERWWEESDERGAGTGGAAGAHGAKSFGAWAV